jgi:hypothetical protein
VAESEVIVRKSIIVALFAFLLGAATFSLLRTARGQEAQGLDSPRMEVQGENRRAIEGSLPTNDPQAPDISFIDSPSPTCYQPNPGRDECYLTWYYMSVSAAPATYMITMTVTLNDFGPVAHTHGFFQSSMYIPYSMLGDGFKVACGPPGAGGNPALGNAYGYSIRARDSNGLSSSNFGSIYCPPFTP